MLNVIWGNYRFLIRSENVIYLDYCCISNVPHGRGKGATVPLHFSPDKIIRIKSMKKTNLKNMGSWTPNSQVLELCFPPQSTLISKKLSKVHGKMVWHVYGFVAWIKDYGQECCWSDELFGECVTALLTRKTCSRNLAKRLLAKGKEKLIFVASALHNNSTLEAAGPWSNLGRSISNKYNMAHNCEK